MSGQPVPGDQFANFAVVVGPVQARALGAFAFRFGALDRDRVQRALQQLVIVAARAGMIEPDRDPCGVREDRVWPTDRRRRAIGRSLRFVTSGLKSAPAHVAVDRTSHDIRVTAIRVA
jgi:hypothetical protein